MAKRPDTKKDKRANACAKAHNVAFRVAGTLVSATADDPATPASEATVTLTLRSANRHARRSGDIADQDPVKKGVQVKGATSRSRGRCLQAQAARLPGARHAVARRPRRRQRPDRPHEGALRPRRHVVADRYGAIDVRRVTIGDRDPD